MSFQLGDYRSKDWSQWPWLQANEPAVQVQWVIVLFSVLFHTKAETGKVALITNWKSSYWQAAVGAHLSALYMPILRRSERVLIRMACPYCLVLKLSLAGRHTVTFCFRTTDLNPRKVFLDRPIESGIFAKGEDFSLFGSGVRFSNVMRSPYLRIWLKSCVTSITCNV